LSGVRELGKVSRNDSRGQFLMIFFETSFLRFLKLFLSFVN
jgi:hypothetical protein